MDNRKFPWDDGMILQLYIVAKYSNTHVNNNKINSGTQENKFAFIAGDFNLNLCAYVHLCKCLHCSVICINSDPSCKSNICFQQEIGNWNTIYNKKYSTWIKADLLYPTWKLLGKLKNFSFHNQILYRVSKEFHWLDANKTTIISS